MERLRSNLAYDWHVIGSYADDELAISLSRDNEPKFLWGLSPEEAFKLVRELIGWLQPIVVGLDEA